MRSMMSTGDRRMSTVGPTGELKGGMVRGERVEDQQGRVPELDLPPRWEGGVVEQQCHHRHHLLHPPGL